MSIVELTYQERARYHKLGAPTPPDYIFLGHEEWKELAELAGYFGVAEVNSAANAPLSRRMVFMGMAVYQVDAHSHISFGNSQPSPCG